MQPWLQKVVKPEPARTTGESGQVIEWHKYFIFTYGKLVPESALEPSTEDAARDSEKETVDNFADFAIATVRDTSRLRWHNTLNVSRQVHFMTPATANILYAAYMADIRPKALPIYLATTITHLFPLDLWLPTFIHYFSHDPSTIPSPTKAFLRIFQIVFLTILSILLFTGASCIANHRGNIASVTLWTSLGLLNRLNMLSQPLFILGIIGHTTIFRWPLLLSAAWIAGLANSLFLRNTMAAFDSRAFSPICTSSTADSPRRKSTEIFIFLLQLLAKSLTSIYLAYQLFTNLGAPNDTSTTTTTIYLTPSNMINILSFYPSMYALHVISSILAQHLSYHYFPRANIGALLAVFDRKTWAIEMRVGRGLDPGAVEVSQEQGEMEDVRVVPVFGLPMVLFFVVYMGVAGWYAVRSLVGLVGWGVGR